MENTRMLLSPLLSSHEQVRIACDTEFQGPHTLAVQFATRIGGAVAVQVYRSPAVPEPPGTFRLRDYLPQKLRDHCDHVDLRPVQPITAGLSPVRVLTDLLQVEGIRSIPRRFGNARPESVLADDPLRLTLVAHFWAADFFRVFGRHFFASLVLPGDAGQGRLAVQAQKLLGFREVKGGAHCFADPVLQYAEREGCLHPVKVRTFDINLPFGGRALNELAQAFLGVGKLDVFGTEEKARMLETFHRRPEEAYAYAALDAVLTLLVEERMRAEDRKMYLALGFGEDDVPPLRVTQGSRVAETITKAIARDCAAGSAALSRRGRRLKSGEVGAVSMAKVKALLARGGGAEVAGERLSRFGEQTGDTHGGLLFTRSPAQFFHEAPGQFRDVDLSGCYAAIIAGMNLYAGRPVLHEPGAGRMTLRDAISFLGEHAAGRDAWVVKVSGRLSRVPNVLIPSTQEALTSANYQKRAARRRARAARRYAVVFDWTHGPRQDTGRTALYTDVVEAGVVAWPTWLLIQALPAAARAEYEALEVDSVLFYPALLVADGGPAYDALLERYARAQAPWCEAMDMKRLERVTKEYLDADYAALRFPLGQLARKIMEFRARARRRHGKGCALELAWKQHANSIYGVTASRYLPTNNVVCANVITATARALAFALQLSLNGVQVITDGCTYRRDQIPAGTFAECLRASPEYPILRGEGGIRFADAAAVPQDDAGFTAWYRRHVLRFFGVRGRDYEELFGTHALEHKKCGAPARAAFDGLCCDGPGNYLKLLQRGGGWEAVDAKARGFNREAKGKLVPWIMQTYREDRYTSPPPLTESTSLLSYQDAVTAGRQALGALEGQRTPLQRQEAPAVVVFPLGLARRRVQAYKVLKPSAFLFRTPEQRAKVAKAMQKFADAHGCGLEALALRRGHGGRRQGSLADVARKLYDFIRAGGDNLTKEMNLTRPFQELERLRPTHLQALAERKREARQCLFAEIDAAGLSPEAMLTGLYVQQSDVLQVL